MNKYFNNLLMRIGALSLILLALATTSCSLDSDEQPTTKPIKLENLNVFIINSGKSGDGNASLDLYSPATKALYKKVFESNNGIPLGNTAQSGTVYGNDLYMAIGGSGVIHKLSAQSMKRTGQLELEGPRYLYFVSAEKAYVSHLGSGDITIINPKTMTATGKITTYQSAIEDPEKWDLSTEEWLKVDNKHVLVSCWSNNSKVLLIDTTQDRVVKEIEVGLQPKSMGMDKNGKVWVLCEGKSWEGKNPTIWTIDTKADYAAAQFGEEIQKIMKWGATSALRMNATGNAFYFYNAPHVFKMSITDKAIPTTPFIMMPEGCQTYSLGLAPNGDLYIGDAKDYKQEGTVYRYSAAGEQLDSFSVGISPIDFVFYVKK